MSLLANKSIGKEIKNNFLSISDQAKKEKSKDPKVINATTGMLYDQNGSLYEFNSLINVEKSLNKNEKFTYSPTAGTNEYEYAIKKWVFQDYLSEMENDLEISVISTPGGTGAISNAFDNYINEGEYVLLPNHMWPCYKNIVREHNINYDTYDIYDLNDLKEKMLNHKVKQNRVFLVLNDPCHNPTGHSLEYHEWKKLIKFINEITADNTPFVLVYDMAYIDFDPRGLDDSRKNLTLLKDINDSVIAILAFSGSKTFSLYGVRIGAMLGVTKLKENIEEFFKSNEYSSRTKWSNTSRYGMSIISKCILNDNLCNQFMDELEEARNLVIERSDLMINLLNENNIEYLPYSGGYFISLPVDNPVETMHKLIEKKLYIVPTERAIRLALCSITKEEIIRLVDILKEVL